MDKTLKSYYILADDDLLNEVLAGGTYLEVKLYNSASDAKSDLGDLDTDKVYRIEEVGE